MQSIFNAADLQALTDRILRLSPDSPAQWGKMTVAQMLVHAQQPLRVATGELKLKRGLIGILFGGMARRKFTGTPTPFGQNLPTDPNFLVKDQPDFETAQKGLIALLQQVGKAGPAGLTKEPHPFFGKMTENEWDTLLWKHTDHHLKQFGC